MKGTLISVDFVKDSDGNYRFVEMNTDTAASNNFINTHLDWSELIAWFTSTPELESSVDTVGVVFKEEIHRNLVNSLSQSIHTNLGDQITTWVEESEDIDTIYPTTIEDNYNKMIIRMAYDENAILDSTYCKNASNALELFVDNDDSGSCVNFYYSSSEDGVYDSLDISENSSPFPDFVYKHKTPHNSVQFGKIPHVSDSATLQERWDKLKEYSASTGSNDELFIMNYHVAPSYSTDNVVQSLRQYYIVHGDNLSLFHIGSHVIPAQYTLPSSSVIDTASYNQWSSSIEMMSGSNVDDIPYMYPRKHYYEYSTSLPKENRVNMDGVYETEQFVSSSDENVVPWMIPTGSTLKTIHIAGMPDTDVSSEYLQFSYTGSALPSGSYETSSVVTSVSWQPMKTNTLFEVSLSNDDKKYFGEGAAVLTYSTSSDETRFEIVNTLEADDNYFVNKDGNLIDITSVKHLVFTEPTGSFVKIDVESTDTLLTDGNYFSIVVHNACFVEGTTISLSNGDTKNIEDIIVGDEVLSYNEETKEIESKKVIGTQTPNHTNLVKYKLSNGTELVCTHDHPFYIECDAKDLASFKPGKTLSRYNWKDDRVALIEVGDNLYDSNLEPVTIESIEDISNETVKTFIFQVEDNSNFFANGILTHNKGQV